MPPGIPEGTSAQETIADVWEALTNERPALSERFQRDAGRWDLRAFPDGLATIAGRALQVTALRPETAGGALLLADPAPAQAIAVDAEIVGDGVATYGILFDRTGADDYAYLAFNAQGQVALFRKTAEGWAVLLPYQPVIGLDTELGATNRLHLLVAPPHVAVLVNDTVVAWFQDNSLTAGDVGLMVESAKTGDATVHFDNVQRWVTDEDDPTLAALATLPPPQQPADEALLASGEQPPLPPGVDPTGGGQLPYRLPEFEPATPAQPGANLLSRLAPETNAEMRDYYDQVFADVNSFWESLWKNPERPFAPADFYQFTSEEPLEIPECAYSATVDGVEVEMTTFDPFVWGSFYCASTRTIYYVPPQFVNPRIETGSPFGEAVVIAHEYAHHIQSLLGVSDDVAAAQREAADDPQTVTSLGRALENQADCLAGVWVFAEWAANEVSLPELRDAIDGIEHIGTDAINPALAPENYTHGSSRERLAWFDVGFRTGDGSLCYPFGGAAPEEILAQALAGNTAAAPAENPIGLAPESFDPDADLQPAAADSLLTFFPAAANPDYGCAPADDALEETVATVVCSLYWGDQPFTVNVDQWTDEDAWQRYRNSQAFASNFDGVDWEPAGSDCVGSEIWWTQEGVDYVMVGAYGTPYTMMVWSDAPTLGHLGLMSALSSLLQEGVGPCTQ
jgi:hypothetical protein